MNRPPAAHDGPRLRVDLAALAHNWHAVRRASPGGRIGAVLKNDAYGLGTAAIAPRLWQLGCRDFWVATVDEALAVRACLPADGAAAGLRILVLNGLAGLAAADFAAHGLIPVLAGRHELAALAGHAARHGERMAVALHLDTGLTRLGFGAEDLPYLLPDTGLWADARAQVWVTHLGRFHDPGLPQCLRQRERFVHWTAQLPRAERSIATSSSVFAGPDWHFEHARVGSALFGVPTGASSAPLQPVASLQAPVLRVTEVAAGCEVGYAGSYVAAGPRRIATVAMGYGDGLPFALVNRGHLILAGRPAPIVGGVAMGMVGLDVSGYAPGEIRPGMWAEVYGRQQPLQTLAAAAGVAANVLLALSARLAPHRCLCDAGEGA
ncbi:MAG: alanine racemase [Rhodocyclaceae bacterium]|nr:alanine racemase [Rhodocyclaceae bacterium]